MPEPTQHDLPVIIGPFRIVRVLGKGGMGVVYLGERVELFSQRVAIKVLHPEISLVLGDQLLHTEDRILTSLDHPGIVRLLDRGQSATGERYIVMEFVDGLSLLDYCAHHNLTQAQRLTLLIQVLQAVDYAHRHLIIHGDLKPQNILVPKSGHPRLLDFGVAAMTRGHGGTDAPSSHTPAFASPEQLAGARLTPASDVYALGRVARAILIAPPPQHSDLEAIIDKATRTDAGERYGTVRDFASDLQSFVDYRAISARRPSRAYLLSKWMRRHRSAAAMAALVALALTCSVLGVAVQTARAERQRSVAQSRLHDLAHLTGTLEGELYDSLPTLPQAEPARAALIQSATDSLDKLAAQDASDSTFVLDMARQYERLSSLPQADTTSDRQKALALLRRISSRDTNYPVAQSLIAELQSR